MRIASNERNDGGAIAAAMPNAAKGVVLGVSNCVLVAIVIACADSRTELDAAFAFAIIALTGLAPASATGAALGWMAGRLELYRFPVLAVLALAVVCALGTVFEPTHHYERLAVAPTLVSVWILERWTRPKPVIPLARALRE